MTNIDARTQRLLAHLWRGGAQSYLWQASPRASFWLATGDALPTVAANRCTYFGIHPVGSIPTHNAKGQPAEPMAVRSQISHIATINCLFGEFDAKDFDSLADAADHIRNIEPAPSAVVFSGGGYHCYWFIRKPFIVETEEDRTRAIDVQARWVEYIGSDPASKDLARVLRLPGTLNYKPQYGPNFPLVKIVGWRPSQTYDFGGLQSLLPEPAPLPAMPTAPLGSVGDGYAKAALTGELDAVARSTNGSRNHQLNKSAFALGQLVQAGKLDAADVSDMLLVTAQAVGLSEHEAKNTIASGLAGGQNKPRAGVRMPSINVERRTNALFQRAVR